jgi:hypothetical protein
MVMFASHDWGIFGAANLQREPVKAQLFDRFLHGLDRLAVNIPSASGVIRMPASTSMPSRDTQKIRDSTTKNCKCAPERNGILCMGLGFRSGVRRARLLMFTVGGG